MSEIYFDSNDEELIKDINVCKTYKRVIEGTVKDCCTGEFLSCVTVKCLSDQGVQVVNTITDCDGKFTLITDYKSPLRLVFYKCGYNTVYTGIFEGSFINISICEEKDNKKVVRGKVKFCNDIKNVSLLRVRLESLENNNIFETFTDVKGKFYIANVIDGNYKLIIDGNNTFTYYKDICISGCKTMVNISNIILQHKSVFNTINGKVIDFNGVAVKDGFVVLSCEKNKDEVIVTKTNENGEYFFGHLNNKDYYLNVYFS
ncbi:MAG: hypothetical protein ACRCZK_05105 [Oscillospiraceae bacterium]